MTSLLIYRLAIAAVLGSAGITACSEEPQRQANEIPIDARNALIAWSQCRTGYINDRIEASIPADALVDDALDHCADRQEALEREFVRMGGDWVGLSTEWRARYRGELIEMINIHRNGTAPDDPSAAWGQCLGRHLPEELTRAEYDRAFDAALSSCVEQQAALKAWLIEVGGAEQADAQLEIYIGEVYQAFRP